MVYRGLYSCLPRVRVNTFFPNIFFVLFLHVERVYKSFCTDNRMVFERKVRHVQVAQLHNAACALSSPSRCFNCQQILANISFIIFDIMVKKKQHKLNVV